MLVFMGEKKGTAVNVYPGKDSFICIAYIKTIEPPYQHFLFL